MAVVAVCLKVILLSKESQKLNKYDQMETKMKPQIQSTVYPEIPCSNFNEWINYIRKEVKKNLKPKVYEGSSAPHLKVFFNTINLN
jgi:hypothetical protein